MDLGHAAENIHIQAVSLNLGTVVIAAFRRDDVKKLLGLPEEETPLYMMPVGNLLG
jgi:nitroreductase